MQTALPSMPDLALLHETYLHKAVNTAGVALHWPNF